MSRFRVSPEKAAPKTGAYKRFSLATLTPGLLLLVPGLILLQLYSEYSDDKESLAKRIEPEVRVALLETQKTICSQERKLGTEVWISPQSSSWRWQYATLGKKHLSYDCENDEWGSKAVGYRASYNCFCMEKHFGKSGHRVKISSIAESAADKALEGKHSVTSDALSGIILGVSAAFIGVWIFFTLIILFIRLIKWIWIGANTT